MRLQRAGRGGRIARSTSAIGGGGGGGGGGYLVGGDALHSAFTVGDVPIPGAALENDLAVISFFGRGLATPVITGATTIYGGTSTQYTAFAKVLSAGDISAGVLSYTGGNSNLNIAGMVVLRGTSGGVGDVVLESFPGSQVYTAPDWHRTNTSLTATAGTIYMQFCYSNNDYIADPVFYNGASEGFKYATTSGSDGTITGSYFLGEGAAYQADTSASSFSSTGAAYLLSLAAA